MERFIGTKIVFAEPMEKDGKAGYKVVYEDGYESWSPADAFDRAYRRADGLPFGLAIEAAKKGARVARRGWNGKDMYICLAHIETFSTPADISSARNEDGTVEVMPFLMMKTADNKMCAGWLASQTDMLADDWYIVDFEPAVMS